MVRVSKSWDFFIGESQLLHDFPLKSTLALLLCHFRLTIITIKKEKRNLKKKEKDTFAARNFKGSTFAFFFSSAFFSSSAANSSLEGNTGGFPYCSISRRSLSAQAYNAKDKHSKKEHKRTFNTFMGIPVAW